MNVNSAEAIIKPVVNKFSQKGYYKRVVEKRGAIRIEKRRAKDKTLAADLLIKSDGTRRYRTHKGPKVETQVILQNNLREYYVHNEKARTNAERFRLQKKLQIFNNKFVDWHCDLFDETGKVIKQITKYFDGHSTTPSKPVYKEVTAHPKRRFVPKSNY